MCYDLKDVFPSSLRSTPHKYFSSLTPLNVPTEEHNNINDENNQRQSIEFDRSVSVGTQECTYD